MDQALATLKPPALTGHHQPDVLQVILLLLYGRYMNDQGLEAIALVRWRVMGLDLLALRMSLNMPMFMTYLLSFMRFMRNK